MKSFLSTPTPFLFCPTPYLNRLTHKTFSGFVYIIFAHNTPSKMVCNTAYKASYSLQYGLAVISRTPTTVKVNAAKCHFCQTFGGEPIMQGRIAKTNRDRKDHKVFSTKFITDAFLQHQSLMHRDHWRKYKELTNAEKAICFSVETPFGETIPSFFDLCDQAKVKIDVPIIDNVIKKILHFRCQRHRSAQLCCTDN